MVRIFCSSLNNRDERMTSTEIIPTPDVPGPTAAPEPPAPEPLHIKKLPFLLRRTSFVQPVPVVLARDLPRSWEKLKDCNRQLRMGMVVHLYEMSEVVVATPTGPQIQKQFTFLEGGGHYLLNGQFIPPAPPPNIPDGPS